MGFPSTATFTMLRYLLTIMENSVSPIQNGRAMNGGYYTTRARGTCAKLLVGGGSIRRVETESSNRRGEVAAPNGAFWDVSQGGRGDNGANASGGFDIHNQRRKSEGRLERLRPGRLSRARHVPELEGRRAFWADREWRSFRVLCSFPGPLSPKPFQACFSLRAIWIPLSSVI
ncbi:hypothetical protein KSP40_PGU011774 [Platanthera guangdongensis]|uniref:Uncharacterized protein n=1 Tax=Platanthera guangdongensis TaxID=2320717 RepID=A0ABR2LE19_9ASPA